MNRLLIFIAGVLLATQVFAQGTVADYQRAESIATLFKNKVFNDLHDFYWLDGSTLFWYKNTTHTGNEFLLVDVVKKTQQPAFDHTRLAKTLSQKLGKHVDLHKLPFDKIEFSRDLKTLLFQIDNGYLQNNR